MFRNFKMKFEYRYVINDNAVICFAKPAMSKTVIDPWFKLYCTVNEQRPKNLIPYEYKGIAKLKDGDVNDVEAAKAIARSKAVRAAFKGFRNLANEIFDYFVREISDFGGTLLSIDAKIEEVDAEIQELAHPNK